jgi:hypothetical protein
MRNSVTKSSRKTHRSRLSRPKCAILKNKSESYGSYPRERFRTFPSSTYYICQVEEDYLWANPITCTYTHTSLSLCFVLLVRDMLAIMEEYGSETTEATLSSRRKAANVKKSSVVRQFRRWNPNLVSMVTKGIIRSSVSHISGIIGLTYLR